MPRHDPRPPPPKKGEAEHLPVLRLLNAIEMPDCDCNPRADEECTCAALFADELPRALRRRGLAAFPWTVEEWGEVLALLDGAYRDPPPPAGPELAMSREVVVAVYEERAARDGRGRATSASRSLYHEGDAWRGALSYDALAVAVHRGRNGSVCEDGPALTRRAA
jgi:hypothetical protein